MAYSYKTPLAVTTQLSGPWNTYLILQYEALFLEI